MCGRAKGAKGRATQGLAQCRYRAAGAIATATHIPTAKTAGMLHDTCMMTTAPRGTNPTCTTALRPAREPANTPTTITAPRLPLHFPLPLARLTLPGRDRPRPLQPPRQPQRAVPRRPQVLRQRLGAIHGRVLQAGRLEEVPRVLAVRAVPRGIQHQGSPRAHQQRGGAAAAWGATAAIGGRMCQLDQTRARTDAMLQQRRGTVVPLQWLASSNTLLQRRAVTSCPQVHFPFPVLAMGTHQHATSIPMACTVYTHPWLARRWPEIPHLFGGHSPPGMYCMHSPVARAALPGAYTATSAATTSASRPSQRRLSTHAAAASSAAVPPKHACSESAPSAGGPGPNAPSSPPSQSQPLRSEAVGSCPAL